MPLKSGAPLALKAAGSVCSPLGLALWYVLAGALDFSVRAGLSEANLLSRGEGRLLMVTGALSLAAAFLAGAARFRRSLLKAAWLIGVGLLFVEIAAVCISPQQQMAADLSWALRAALCVHVLAAATVYGQVVAGSLAAELRNAGGA